jgi:DNA-binding IclR family transcriptional regulator
VLECVAAERNGTSLAELAVKLKLHKSTVHRLLMVLERHGLLEKLPDTGRYRLGLKLFELGSRAIAATGLREHARPFLQRVQYETEETVHFCVLEGTEVLYVEKVEPQRSVRMASAVGRRAPAYCTAVGKAMLAELSHAEAEDVIRRSGLRPLTRHTLTTPAEIHAELRVTRTRGYALDDEENEEGVRCVAAAVHDAAGHPIAALSVSGPSFRITKEKVPIVARSVMAAAADMSAQLGYDREVQAVNAGR